MLSPGRCSFVQVQLLDLRLKAEVERIIEKGQIHNAKSKTNHIYEYSKIALTHKQYEYCCIQHSYEIRQVGMESGKDKKRFVFISSIAPNQANIKELTQAGSMRWKIENEGFKTEKARLVLSCG